MIFRKVCLCLVLLNSSFVYASGKDEQIDNENSSDSAEMHDNAVDNDKSRMREKLEALYRCDLSEYDIHVVFFKDTGAKQSSGHERYVPETLLKQKDEKRVLTFLHTKMYTGIFSQSTKKIVIGCGGTDLQLRRYLGL